MLNGKDGGSHGEDEDAWSVLVRSRRAWRYLNGGFKDIKVQQKSTPYFHVYFLR